MIFKIFHKFYHNCNKNEKLIQFQLLKCYKMKNIENVIIIMKFYIILIH